MECPERPGVISTGSELGRGSHSRKGSVSSGPLNFGRKQALPEASLPKQLERDCGPLQALFPSPVSVIDLCF